jgi:hypothetical protein
MIRFSLGYRYNDWLADVFERDNNSVMVPILPMYINVIRIIFDPSESSGVRFIESPTVPKAEKHSKTTRNIPYCPSIRKIPNEPIDIIMSESAIIANALFTEYS